MVAKISEKEFAVIREISNNHRPTQRQIARKAGISLGLTNLIIKRLVKKGYLKIKEAPARTVLYTLTPLGFAEKARKSYYFTLHTTKLIRTLKEKIQEIIAQEYNQGSRKIVIYGNGEMAILAEIAIRDLKPNGITYERIESKAQGDKLKCTLVFLRNDSEKKIDIISELSRRGVYY